MYKVTYVHPDGMRQVVDTEEGQSVMRTALNNLVPGIVGECGGEMSCATCHVYVDPEWSERAGTPDEWEQDMLEVASEEPNEFSRLSCQIKMSAELDGIVVTIPATQN